MEKLNEIVMGERIVLVEFFATWCPHCQRMRPILDDLKKKIGSKMKMKRFDIDSPANARLLEYYRIQSVPTMLLFREGEQVWRLSGEMLPEQLEDVISRYS